MSDRRPRGGEMQASFLRPRGRVVSVELCTHYPPVGPARRYLCARTYLVRGGLWTPADTGITIWPSEIREWIRAANTLAMEAER